MNRHEDDDLGHPSSTSSRHGSSLLKYDDITILIGELTFIWIFLKSAKICCTTKKGRKLQKMFSEALTGQQYELKCSPTENVLSIKSKLLY